MLKVAIFDLDGTLIDTETIKEYLFDFLAVCGFKGDQAVAVYKSARNANPPRLAVFGEAGGRNQFTLDSFKEKLEMLCAKEGVKFNENDWQKMEKELRNKKESLLIKGVKEVLQFLKDKKVPFYILTLGVPEWQKEKIRLSGLDKILLNGEKDLNKCKNIKYTIHEDAKEGKIKEIRDILQEVNSKNGEGVMFFNDKPDETKEIMAEFPQMKVFVRRENRDKRFSEQDFEELGNMPQVIQISEKFNFIKKIEELI